MAYASVLTRNAVRMKDIEYDGRWMCIMERLDERDEVDVRGFGFGATKELAHKHAAQHIISILS